MLDFSILSNDDGIKHLRLNIKKPNSSDKIIPGIFWTGRPTSISIYIVLFKLEMRKFSAIFDDSFVGPLNVLNGATIYEIASLNIICKYNKIIKIVFLVIIY